MFIVPVVIPNVHVTMAFSNGIKILCNTKQNTKWEMFFGYYSLWIIFHFGYVAEEVKIRKDMRNLCTVEKVMLCQIFLNGSSGRSFPIYTANSGINPLNCTIIAPIQFLGIKETQRILMSI